MSNIANRWSSGIQVSINTVLSYIPLLAIDIIVEIKCTTNRLIGDVVSTKSQNRCCSACKINYKTRDGTVKTTMLRLQYRVTEKKIEHSVTYARQNVFCSNLHALERL